MGAYVNVSLLDELFASVEERVLPTDRLDMIRRYQNEFVDRAVTSLERVAYDLAEDGWTARQIAHEIGVSRNYIPAMAAAHAGRTGRLSPFRSTRAYDHAVDISGLVSKEASRRAGEVAHAQGEQPSPPE